jgi:hypothetical protein
MRVARQDSDGPALQILLRRYCSMGVPIPNENE